MGQENFSIEILDHSENPNVVAKDQVKIPLGLIKLHKEVLLTCNIFFCEQYPILPEVESEDIIHGSQSPRKLHSLRNIQIFQGGISVLPTSWLPYHPISFIRRVWSFEDPDRVPTMVSTSKYGHIKLTRP